MEWIPTAIQCLNRAKQLAPQGESAKQLAPQGENQEMRHDTQLADQVKCRCDHGQIRGEITSIGGTHDSVPVTLEIPCSDCQGIFQSIGCQCETPLDPCYAPDGHQVFGNDTYLCRGCGMVTQFG
jgi:hypothetical protein